MDERVVRVLGKLARVLRDRILWTLACPQRLGDRRADHLWAAAGGGCGLLVRREVWEVRIWGGGDIRGLLRVGDGGEQYRRRVC